jgi:NAD-dependent DNA ligase
MIEIPKNCPACSSLLETVNEQLFCRNKACPAQLAKKLEHFCKVLGIKGLGPKTLEKLDLTELFDVFTLDEQQLSTALGSTVVAKKLLTEIDKAKHVSLSTVLESFAIPLLGSTASKKLATVVASVDEINNETCLKAGLGPTVTKNLMDWLESDYNYIKDSMPFVFTKESAIVSSGKTVCITGKLKSFKTKADAEAALRMHGLEPVSSVTKGTNYLVDETSANSSKRQQAEKYNIPIIDNLTNFLKDI